MKEEKEKMEKEKDRLIELLQENIKSMGQQYENVLSVRINTHSLTQFS